ncbi:hypothetical protein ATCC90586_008386 [Pythium insidiosum]|nr:hypothetical protein ATCC90586_008386 [Pythium insidiosum]
MALESAAASFLPTPAEVTQAVQWVRENPALALGAVVGLTGFTVARYYDLIENEQQLGDSADNGDSMLDLQTQMNDMCIKSPTCESPAATSDSSAVRASASDGTQSSMASRVSADQLAGAVEHTHDHHPHSSNAAQQPTSSQKRACSFCNIDELESTHMCCDPDWGWFVPTSPADEEHSQLVR